MVSEFEFINNLKSKYSLAKVGDDCAVLPKDAETDLLLTADMLVEDIDFRLEWTTPEFLGHKALAVSLSDIAAMGGEPKWAMLSIGIPKNLWATDFIDKFYEGWFTLANEYKVELVGGDVSRSPDKLVIDSVAGGEVPKGKAILRYGAKSGDAIFVSGSLGGAAGGLKILESGSISDSELVSKQLQPIPQLELAKRLQQKRLATAMIDISDGLSSDLYHICSASGVGAQIDAGMLPIHRGLSINFPVEECLEMALNGGEDFELLFTADPEKMATAKIAGITRIGEIHPDGGILVLIHDCRASPLIARGYHHF